MTQWKLDSPAAIEAVAVARLLRSREHEALLVGGCVRDLLMGRQPKDYDVATNATPPQVLELFPKAIPVGAKFGVVIVLSNGIQTEIATFREETGYSDRRHPDQVKFSDAPHDALRRDFTINGLFMDPLTGAVFDHVNGLSDLNFRILRCIRNPAARFQEDALRLLRGIRLASSLGFEIEALTWRALMENVELIREISVERIRDELTKGLTQPNRGRFLQLFSDSGLMKILLPEAEPLIGCRQPPQFHPEGDVFTHTKLVLDHLPEDPSPELAFAALLHDIAKPVTATETDRIRFNNHNKVGAEMADEICRRLAFSNESREKVVSMVRRHMDFINFPKMRVSSRRRFLAADTIDDELLLHRADCLGSYHDVSTYTLANELLTQERESQDAADKSSLPKPLLTGDDLIAAGLSPGPRFKSLLTRAFDEQLEGRISSHDEAAAWLKTWLEEEGHEQQG